MITIRKVNDGYNFDVMLEKLPNLGQDIFISSHSTCSSLESDKITFVFGGYQQNKPEITESIQESNVLFVIDNDTKFILKKVAPTDLATAGQTMFLIDSDALLINGGAKKTMSLYTKKELIPDKCELADKCTVDESTVAPIPWVKCDGQCNRWLHQHCIKLKVIAKGTFYCDDCKAETLQPNAK